MNHLCIIGNLVKAPESRETPNGKKVCNFTIAVNSGKKDSNGNQPATYFRVSAWEALGDICQRYLAKGQKVAVTGSVNSRAYTTQDGQVRSSLEVTARDVEFLQKSANDGGTDGE